MKNSCDEILEAKTAEQEERAKKLYRYVSDVARRVGDATVGCRNISDLFTTMIEVQRQKLRDNCEKLLFLDPTNHGKKALELLWRKVYYDTISAAKKLRESDLTYDSYIFTHIVGGIGNFHHLITRMQSDLMIQFKELDYLTILGAYDEEGEVQFPPTEENLQFGKAALHSCLIYLGDLSRYQTEIFHTFDSAIAARYYLQAAHIDLSSGMPYNQLANLYLDKNYNLDSVCYYIHCLSCAAPFEGALGNLTKIFEKNTQFCETLNESESLAQSEHVQNTAASFLSLIEIWYLNKDDTNIPQRCSVIAQQLKIAMDFAMTPLPDINKNYEEYNQAIEEENINPSYLNENLVHKVVQICLFTMVKVADIDEQKAFACKAFTLALLSQLLQKLLKQLLCLGFKNPARHYKPRINSIEESDTEPLDDEPNEELTPVEIITNGKNHKEDDIVIVEEPIKDDVFEEDVKKKPNGEIKNGTKKTLLKRRRRRKVASSDSSDLSGADSDSSEGETEVSGSEEEDDLSESSGQSEDESKTDGSTSEHSDSEELKVNGLAPEEIKTNNNKPPPTINNNNNHENGVYKGHDDDEYKLNEDAIKDFLLGNNILPSIKLLQDWILTEKELIVSCGESGESLFQCVVDLLNIFTHYFNSKSEEVQECNILQYVKKLVKKFKLEFKTIPLPEDVNLRGTNICKFDKDAAEWQLLEKYNPSIYEENVIRILNFIEFGNHIAKIVPKIRYNRGMKIFYLKRSAHSKSATKVIHKRSREWHNSKTQQDPESETGSGHLQKRMGQLWLAAKVQELEGAARGGGGAGELLAVDAAALHAHLRRVKQLARTKRFILLVPHTVLQELDDLKCSVRGARDAIRWLEEQLKARSRWLRAQKPGQTLALPGNPSRKHNIVPILEFCHHLVAATGAAGDGSLLTLLRGDSSPIPAGVAPPPGVAIEGICEFYARWRRQQPRAASKR